MNIRNRRGGGHPFRDIASEEAKVVSVIICFITSVVAI